MGWSYKYRHWRGSTQESLNPSFCFSVSLVCFAGRKKIGGCTWLGWWLAFRLGQFHGSHHRRKTNWLVKHVGYQKGTKVPEPGYIAISTILVYDMRNIEIKNNPLTMNLSLGHLATDTAVLVFIRYQQTPKPKKSEAPKGQNAKTAGNDTCEKVSHLGVFAVVTVGLNRCLRANIVHHQRVMIPWIHRDHVLRIRNECNSLDANLHQYE